MTTWLQIVPILQPLLTPVIAGIVAYIAWQQWKANTLKLKLERYDRRMRVYQEVVGFLSLVMRDFNPTVPEVLTFRREAAEADFLFGPEIPAYIKEVGKKALDLHVARSQYRDMTQVPPPGYDHQKVCNAMHELETWFSQQHDVAFGKFKPYLHISDDR